MPDQVLGDLAAPVVPGGSWLASEEWPGRCGQAKAAAIPRPGSMPVWDGHLLDRSLSLLTYPRAFQLPVPSPQHTRGTEARGTPSQLGLSLAQV